MPGRGGNTSPQPANPTRQSEHNDTFEKGIEKQRDRMGVLNRLRNKCEPYVFILTALLFGLFDDPLQIG